MKTVILVILIGLFGCNDPNREIVDNVINDELVSHDIFKSRVMSYENKEDLQKIIQALILSGDMILKGQDTSMMKYEIYFQDWSLCVSIPMDFIEYK